VAPVLSAVAKEIEEIEICKELLDRAENVFLDPRDNQYLEQHGLKDLQEREWLGTHHINGALAMLRFVNSSCITAKLDHKHSYHRAR
jgi:hypothetical protein